MTTVLECDLKHHSLQLLREYQQTGKARLRNQIVELNLGLVRKEAHFWTNQCQETYDDLLQVGSIGLINAIDKFEIGKGCAFSTFATPYIRGEIQHYLRDKSSVLKMPRRWFAIIQQAGSITKVLQSRHQRQPTEAEIALELDISVAEWQEIKMAYQNRQPVSLDCPVGSDEDANNLADLLPDRHYQSFQLFQEDRLRVQQGLIALEQHTRQILEFVFLHDLTQKQVAERMDISVITVSRHVKKGLNVLKLMMVNNEN
ncbi:RNA polymerase sigma factor SigF [Chamaesiphon sp. VAR_48_metabat_135_sub]|jgi:RNA polymerase sigma-B factor|uniref:RNA polymerase sigma factor SigF n=1 Tax=Chamaesiphon sp. VAR_48_metabat_135_sub TaxID=2964699 RepID=UPI00286CFC85|nr:RNA polymerase sigma factor SigF [Chamaesiphon sp. VAR_48_metabat_135_sub]